MITEPNSTLPDPMTQAVFYQGVPLKRLLAWVVDVTLILATMLVLVVLTFGLAFWLWPLFWVGVSFAYRSFTITRGSATWGMWLMSLELRNARGMRFTRDEAMIHSGIYLATMISLAPQLFSAFLCLTKARHQTLSDHFLGSAAINKPGD